MVTSTCPDRNDLRSFHLGMLDERRELEVLDHLNDCPTCEDTVANLEGTADSLVAAVRSSGDTSGNSESAQSEDRPALQRALAEIEGFVDPPSPGSPAVETEASPVSERIRDYELLGTLGEGGMGTVYRARHTRLDRQVALKLLPARRLRDNAAVARFEREMKAIGRLDHPTIVRATDAGDVDGTHFLAMDYVEGIDLSKLVRLVGPLDVPSACEIVRQAALGLDYAHQQELIHRDVKPSNLMLTLRGEVRILDLGLALFGAASEALDELTTVGQLMGTLDYMAPEQGDNSHDVDARADVYSLGATLFKLLTATAPYDSPGTRTPLAKMKALATIDAPSVAERRSELPAELVAVVDRALLRNVDDRYVSAKELADALLPFCEGHVLSDLAECGRDLAMSEDENIPQPPTLPPVVQKLDVRAAEPNPKRLTESEDDRSGIGRKVATWMLLPLILLAGIVIWIQTDNGTLLIEADESVPIEIRRTGKPARRETLQVGQNSLTISSGDYEIVLPKGYDSLKVSDGKFELSRGGTWIARVTKQTREASHSGSALREESPPGASIGRSLPADGSDQTRRADATQSRATVRNAPPLSATADPFATPDPFAPPDSAPNQTAAVPQRAPQSSGDPFAPGIPPSRFELETTVWEIDQKAIRDGVTGPPLLSPRSALELLDPIVSGDFKYPHQEFRDQPLPPFVLYRTRENVTQVFHAPPLNKCVRKVNSRPTKSEHDPEPEAGSGAYTDADAGFLTSDGSRYSRRLAPARNAAGQMTLTLEFERALRIGEPRAGERTHRKTFTVDPLREDETLIVLEVDPNADIVWLWEIKPGQKGRNLLEKSVPATVPLAVTSRQVPLQLRTTVWRIDQKTIRSGATKPVELQPHSVVGLLSKLVSLKFSPPQHPYPAFGMFRTQLDVASVLKQPGLSHCTEQVHSSVSRHGHTQQVGPLTGPLTSEDVSEVAKGDDRRVTLKLTPVVTEAGPIELNVQVDRTIAEPVNGRDDRSGVFDARVDTPATQNFDSSFLAYGQSLFVLELDPLADEILLFEIHPVRPAPSVNPFVPPSASSPRTSTVPGTGQPPTSPFSEPTPYRPAGAVLPQIVFHSGVWEVDESKLKTLKPTQNESGSVVDALLSELGLRYIDPKALARNPSVGLWNGEAPESLRKLVETGAVSFTELPILQTEPNKTAVINFHAIFGKRLDLKPRLAKSKLWIDLGFKITEPDRAPPPANRDDFEATFSMDWGQSLLLVERNYRPGRVLLLTVRPERTGALTDQATMPSGTKPPFPTNLQATQFADPFAGPVMAGSSPMGVTIPSPPVRVPNLVPVFSGKTFEDWQTVVLTERNPDDLKTAVEAFGRLGRGGRDVEAAETIFKILAPYDPELIAGVRSGRQPLSGESSLLMAALSQLRRLDPDAVTQVIIRIMPAANDNTRRLILEQFANSSSGMSPLRDRLRSSQPFLAVVVAAWPTLDEANQSLAFHYVTQCERSGEMGADLNRFLSQLTHQPESNLFIPAIRTLCEISPDNIGELPAILLDFLETPDDPGSGVAAGTAPQQWPTWLVREHDAWLGLAALKEHAAPYAARIAELLTKADGKIEGRGIDVPIQILLRDHSSGQTSNSHASVTKRQLIYELLGRLGPLAAEQVPLLIELPSKYFAAKPDPAGDYEFVAAHQEFVLDTPGFPLVQMAYETRLGTGGGGDSACSAATAARTQKLTPATR
jgi:serine/threonine protein kinase